MRNSQMVCSPCHNCAASPIGWGLSLLSHYFTWKLCHSCPCGLKWYFQSPLILPPRQWIAHETWSQHNGGNHKEKACYDAFVCEQCKSPHYTNLFSLVHSQDTISGLQSFSDLVDHKSLGAKDHSFFFFLFLFRKNPSILRQGHLSIHTCIDI